MRDSFQASTAEAKTLVFPDTDSWEGCPWPGLCQSAMGRAQRAMGQCQMHPKSNGSRLIIFGHGLAMLSAARLPLASAFPGPGTHGIPMTSS